MNPGPCLWGAYHLCAWNILRADKWSHSETTAHALGHFCSLFQLKSEAIQNAHFQARLNEVIRTLTEVSRGIFSPCMGRTSSPLLSFILLVMVCLTWQMWKSNIHVEFMGCFEVVYGPVFIDKYALLLEKKEYWLFWVNLLLIHLKN